MGLNLYSGQKLKSKESVQTIVTRRHLTESSLVVWTDGACEPNPGFGGWGFMVEDPKSGLVVTENRGGAPDTTNNRMELLAIIRGVEAAKSQRLIVRTDSQLCVLCAIGRWARKTNHDLWLALDEAVGRRFVVFEWWRGHCGTPGNERADELAAIGRNESMEAV